MTREEAVRRGRDQVALAAWEKRWGGHTDYAGVATRGLADALRDLLAVEVEPSEAVKRCKEAVHALDSIYSDRAVWRPEIATMISAIDALPDTLAPVLTDLDKREVQWLRVYVETGNAREMATMKAATDRAIAIIDRLCPPEPKHKPCAGCGAAPEVRSHGSTVHIGCSGGCGFRTESANMVAHAWDVWDRRTS